MPLAIILVIVLGAAGIIGIGRRAGEHGLHCRGGLSVSSMKGMSLRSVDSLLTRLKSTEAPEPVMGAMCYDMAMPLLVDEYICSVCGEKTIYESGSWLLTELPECRSLTEGIAGAVDFEIELVETEFCTHCEPDITDPVIVLRVTRDDGSAVTSSVNRFELILLSSFLDGGLTYSGDQGEEMPLLPYAARISELLGLEGAE